MNYTISGHGTKEPVPTAAEIANVDPALLERAQTYLANTATCNALSPGMLRRVYTTDGQQPQEVGIEAAATVLYALYDLGQVGPPNTDQVGSWAINLTLPDISRDGIPRPRVSQE